MSPQSEKRDLCLEPNLHTASLLVEGWRGVNHSYAMVNQYQLLELMRLKTKKLLHRDMPFAFGHWDRSIHKAGFASADQQRLDSIPAPTDEQIDHVYRIVSPFLAPDPQEERKTTTFMITELGLSDSSFAAGSKLSDGFTRDGNIIVTTTRWSRDRIVEYGFAEDKVAIVPLGVDSKVFTPLAPEERRRVRGRLGIHDNETVFLNIGVAVWNKGIDALLRAFAHLRATGRRVRLILKDQRDVYGISVEQTILNLGTTTPALLKPETLAAIMVIPGNLDRTQLRQLYGMVDCYVSPYRAEGFNLPVIESIACGVPVIVTRGGATDDFCDDHLACRIPGVQGRHQNAAAGYAGCYIEPDIDDLISAMDGFTRGSCIDVKNFMKSRETLLAAFSWKNATAKLAHVIFGGSPCAGHDPDGSTHHIPEVAATRIVRQRDILDLIGIIRPASMSTQKAIRLGSSHDGGYVVPAIALECDAVLSIGVGSEVSFDLALAENGARILQFDHTVEGLPAAHPNFDFHPLGWGTRTEGDYLSLADMRSMLSPLNADRLLLKFDIEGGEYDILESLGDNALADFSVIVCEIHYLSRLLEPDFFAKVHRSLSKLTLHHVPVHLHPNNYGGVLLLEGIPMPDVLEITLLRRDIDVFDRASPAPIPGPLDRPNHPFRVDICLTAFAAAPSFVPRSRAESAQPAELSAL